MGAAATLAVCESKGEPVIIAIEGLKIKTTPMMPLVERTVSIQDAFKNKNWDYILHLRGSNFIRKLEIYRIIRDMEPKNFTNELKDYKFALMHIGSVTSGFNCAARACARYLLKTGAQVYAVFDGVDGIISENIKQVTYFDSLKWHGTGSALGTCRDLHEKEMDKIAEFIGKFNFNGIFIIGGFKGIIYVHLAYNSATTTFETKR